LTSMSNSFFCTQRVICNAFSTILILLLSSLMQEIFLQCSILPVHSKLPSHPVCCILGHIQISNLLHHHCRAFHTSNCSGHIPSAVADAVLATAIAADPAMGVICTSPLASTTAGTSPPIILSTHLQCAVAIQH
jgi:hypothetical protein